MDMNSTAAKPYSQFGLGDFCVKSRPNGGPLITTSHSDRPKIVLPPLTASSVFLGPDGNLGVSKGTYKIETIEKAQYSVSFRLPPPTIKQKTPNEYTGTKEEQNLSDWLYDSQERIFYDFIKSDCKIPKQLLSKNKTPEDIMARREEWMTPFRLGSDGWWYFNMATSCMTSNYGKPDQNTGDAPARKVVRCFKINKKDSVEEAVMDLHRGCVLGVIFAFNLYAVSSTVYGLRAELCTSDIKVFDQGTAMATQLQENVLTRDISKIVEVTITEPKQTQPHTNGDVRTYFVSGDDGHPMTFRFRGAKASFLKGNELVNETGGFNEGFFSVKLGRPQAVDEKELSDYDKFDAALVHICNSALRKIVESSAMDVKRAQVQSQFPSYSTKKVNEIIMSDANVPFKEYADRNQFNVRTKIPIDDSTPNTIVYHHLDGSLLETYTESEFETIQPVVRVQGYVRDNGKRFGISLKWVLTYPTVVCSIASENATHVADVFFGASETLDDDTATEIDADAFIEAEDTEMASYDQLPGNHDQLDNASQNENVDELQDDLFLAEQSTLGDGDTTTEGTTTSTEQHKTETTSEEPVSSKLSVIELAKSSSTASIFHKSPERKRNGSKKKATDSAVKKGLKKLRTETDNRDTKKSKKE